MQNLVHLEAAYEGNSVQFLPAVASDAGAPGGAGVLAGAGRNLSPSLSDIPTSAGPVVAR